MSSIVPTRKVRKLSTVTEDQRSCVLAIYHDCFDRGEWTTKKTKESLDVMIDRSSIMILAAFEEHIDSTSTSSVDQPAVEKLTGIAIITGSTDDPLLEDLLVDSHYRKRGVAASIMEHMLTCFTQSSTPHIDLYCNWSLLSFYERYGFVKLRGEQGERCYMRRSLRSTSQAEMH